MDRSHLEELLASLVRSGGTALYLIAGETPCLRIQGRLVRAEGEHLEPRVLQELTKDFLFADHHERLEQGDEVEVLYSTAQGVRFRTSVARQQHGLNLVFRRVPEQVPTLDVLGLPEQLSSFTEFRHGLVLVSGFISSGRSTTMAAMIDRINEDRAAQIVTLEDPIEFIHTPKKSLVHQRQIGTHVASIRQGARDAAAIGANILCIDKLSDFDDLDAAMDAAERGLLVLACWHGNTVVSSLTDIVALAPPTQTARTRRRLGQCLRAMTSQSLLTRRHDKGRVPLVEILINSDTVARSICRGYFEEITQLMSRGHGLGMQTSDAALRRLLNANLISFEEAQYHAGDREWVTSRVR